MLRSVAPVARVFARAAAMVASRHHRARGRPPLDGSSQEVKDPCRLLVRDGLEMSSLVRGGLKIPFHCQNHPVSATAATSTLPRQGPDAANSAKKCGSNYNRSCNIPHPDTEAATGRAHIGTVACCPSCVPEFVMGALCLTSREHSTRHSAMACAHPRCRLKRATALKCCWRDAVLAWLKQHCTLWLPL